MKLINLSIVNFRGLNFQHDFSQDHFVVLTGVNGSGKSTIIDVLDLMLTKHASNIPQYFAEQVTGEAAEFEMTVSATDEEINYLAERIHRNQPAAATEDQIEQALRSELFVDGIYRRNLTVKHPQPLTEWRQINSVHESINGVYIDQNNAAAASRQISPAVFNVLAQEMVLKFEQLESISMQFSNFNSRKYSSFNIFQTQSPNDQMRISRTNFAANSLLDSLLGYAEPDTSKVDELIAEYNAILDPLYLETREEDGNIVSIVLRRDAQTPAYPVGSASSGQKKALVLATIKYIWKDAILKPIVLLDEPENSMHPGLTTKIFTSLNELAEDESKPSFIIATHSPEVVAANSQNTYRIITSEGRSTLKKVVGLDARADALRELGVHFHLDYVAQKLVFVESLRDRSGGEISDQEAYQRLIDPQKEEVLFVSVGSSNGADRKYEFQNELFTMLHASSPGFVQRLKDRDDNDYDPTQHTPFKHIEYLYVINSNALADALSKALGREVPRSEINNFMSERKVSELLAREDYKKVWEKLVGKYGLRRGHKGFVQGKTVDYLHNHYNECTDEIRELISRYRAVA